MQVSSVRGRSLLHAAVLALLTVTCLLSNVAFAAGAHHGFQACDPSVVQSSGYIDIPGVSGTQKHMFYWLFGPRRWPTDGSQPPVVLWMQGGPGGSSSFGLFLELGPCMMNETTGDLYHNAYGWNDEAYLLFVDQPVASGYSYGNEQNYDHNESEAAEDMYNFLQRFAKKFPSLSITGKNDFYITGESYAGHYVPALAYRILQGNQEGTNPHINLKGIAVGNGFTDPYTQYPYFPELAYSWCQQQLGAPCITADAYRQMKAAIPPCLALIKQCNEAPNDSDPACVKASSVCMPIISYYVKTGRNNYDIRKPCIGDYCYPYVYTQKLLRSTELMSAVGAKAGIVWNSSTPTVSHMFASDGIRNFNYTVPPLLEAGIRVVIYAGDMDFICNWLGNKAWVTVLEWPGKSSFNAASDIEFSVGGRAAGTERTYGGFSFVRIYDAGHMVPMDQPEASLYMLRRFLHGERLAS